MHGRPGLIGGLLKLVLFAGLIAISLPVLFPQVASDPVTALQDGRSLLLNTTAAPDPQSLDVREVEQTVHVYVNRERRNHDLAPLDYDPQLAMIARKYSEDMAERGFFSHYSPEGENFLDRYEAAGYNCRIRDGNTIYRGGENLAKTFFGHPVEMAGETRQLTTVDELAQGIVTQWMNSPEHRENMLEPYWEQEGIGVHITSNGKVLATQNFC